VFVETLVLLLQAGGRTLEDLRELERETALLTLLDHTALPDPDTVDDWLRRMGDPTTGQAGLVGLGQVRDTLDVDATLIEAEKRNAQWSYQGVKGYMPLLGFLFETSICLVDEFREGNVSPGSGHLAFYRTCQSRLPQGKRLAAYRADSASYQAALINALEADGVRWAITTVRWTLMQVSGRIVRHAGQVILKLVLDPETLNRFHQIRQQCVVLAGAT